MTHIEHAMVTIRGKLYNVHTSSVINGKVLVHFSGAEEDVLYQMCGLWLYTDEIDYVRGFSDYDLKLIEDYMDSHTEELFAMAQKTITPQWKIDVEMLDDESFLEKYGVARCDFIPPEEDS